MGVSAYHLLRKQHTEFFTKSFRFALPLGIIAALVTAGQGHHHGNAVAELQPAKLAAMEAHWETEKSAGMSLFVIPGEDGENIVEFGRIPGLLSLLAFNDPSATVIGLNDIPEDERPPVAITFWSFRIMVGLGTLFIAMMAWAWLRRNDIANQPLLLRAFLFAIPLPYIALEAGWTVAEVGRQPWIVQGLLKTSDAVSPALTTGMVGFSFFTIIALYTVLGLMGLGLMIHYVKKGPQH
jgi:cytochrome d ubiquinol oxidase subunit I